MSTLENAEVNLVDTKKRIESLLQRHKIASEKRSTYNGLLEGKRQELEKLKLEIKEAGLDPSKLKEHKEVLQAELFKKITEFEAQLSEVEKAFEMFESAKGKV